MRKLFAGATLGISVLLSSSVMALEVAPLDVDTVVPAAEVAAAQPELMENFVAMSHLPAPPRRPATFAERRASPKAQPVRVVRVMRDPDLVPVRAPDAMPSKRFWMTVGTGF